MGTEADGVWEIGSIDDPSSAGLPRLTETVQDSDLFDGAGVDVTRLAAGEEREIVVPLEVEEPDSTVQRFKLSIRLRMEPID